MNAERLYYTTVWFLSLVQSSEATLGIIEIDLKQGMAFTRKYIQELIAECSYSISERYDTTPDRRLGHELLNP